MGPVALVGGAPWEEVGPWVGDAVPGLRQDIHDGLLHLLLPAKLLHRLHVEMAVFICTTVKHQIQHRPAKFKNKAFTIKPQNKIQLSFGCLELDNTLDIPVFLSILEEHKQV